MLKKNLNQQESIFIGLKLNCSQDGTKHDVDVTVDADMSTHGGVHALTAILREIAAKSGTKSAYEAAHAALRELKNN